MMVSFLKSPVVVTLMALTWDASAPCAEMVDVKYRGLVDLETFSCIDVSRSGFIKRVCYDSA
jgi:hypothetical protein